MNNIPIKLVQRDGHWTADIADEHGSTHRINFGAEYDRALREFEAWLEVIYRGNRSVSTITQSTLTLARAYTLYMQWAEKNYRTAVTFRKTSMTRKIAATLDGFVGRYGHIPLTGLSIAHVRSEILLWIQRGLKRTTVNQYKDTLTRFIVWVVDTFDMHRDIKEKVRAIPTIEAGRAFNDSAAAAVAKEPVPVVPIDPAIVDKTINEMVRRCTVHVDVILLMLNTGMRPSEALQFRMSDVEITEENAWTYHPTEWKTQRKTGRSIYLGPTAQRIISRYYKSLNSTERAFKMSYTSFITAIHRACDRLGIARWNPNQLRHTFATTVAATHGLDVARQLCGHTGLKMTLRYAKIEQSLEARNARKAIAAVG